MFYIFWTCPNCNRTHRYVWENEEAKSIDDELPMNMECENDPVGTGCGAVTRGMKISHILYPEDGSWNGYCVVQTREQSHGDTWTISSI